MLGILLGASVTLNLILIFCWKIMFSAMRKELIEFKNDLENKYKDGGGSYR